jgi:hypothetical protein
MFGMHNYHTLYKLFIQTLAPGYAATVWASSVRDGTARRSLSLSVSP